MCIAIWLYSRVGAQTRRAVICPKDAGNGLVGGARGRSDHAVAPERLHLLERDRVGAAVQIGWRRHPELIARAEHERLDLAPVRAERERTQADRILAPLPRRIARDEVDSDVRLWVPRTVVTTPGEDRAGRCAPELDPVDLGAPLRDGPQVLDEQLVERGRLGRVETDQRVVRGQRDGGRSRRFGGSGTKPGIALTPADDRVHRVEDGDMHDRHGPTRSPGSQLLAEDARVARRWRRVVDTACVDRHFVPVAQPIPGARAASPRLRRAEARLGAKARAEDIAETVRKPLGDRPSGQAEGEHPQHERAARWRALHGALLRAGAVPDLPWPGFQRLCAVGFHGHPFTARHRVTSCHGLDAASDDSQE